MPHPGGIGSRVRRDQRTLANLVKAGGWDYSCNTGLQIVKNGEVLSSEPAIEPAAPEPAWTFGQSAENRPVPRLASGSGIG